MSDKKLIVVFGATGNQGGSVVEQILSDSKFEQSWAIRAITRDVNKPSAKALEAQGVEVVAADLDAPSTLKAAVKGAYAVFAVTNFWETCDPEVEKKQGFAIADAAKDAGVQHLIWSSLPSVTKLSKGRFTKVAHFDAKAEIEDYITKIGVPATFYLAGYFMSNLPGYHLQQMPDDKKWKIILPCPASTQVPLVATAEDTGKFVKGILLNREKVLGKQILGATNYATFSEILNEFKEQYPIAGEGAEFVQISYEAYRDNLASEGRSAFIQDDLVDNMMWISESGYYGGATLDESHSLLVDKLTTWKEYMAKSPVFAELK
ncbi:3f8367d9-64e3-4ab1-ae21-f3ffc836c92d [Sclerotinia trifoliorum]|uniref:3f8367d9-64e3-4ab1-ae21-f3ffc836c92d n=1 Tax=Sclerotinia trifoliorum TaxID=28548 RepID=A0A8H2VP93_9HELO|nr:3f8367d9-64e3-4ab1-ae21-f3ffc836c92d [Sclerotinia trifoliorum]